MISSDAAEGIKPSASFNTTNPQRYHISVGESLWAPVSTKIGCAEKWEPTRDSPTDGYWLETALT
jgi:hypothetical protein